eukprot:TRINITY_DN2081_c0_g2_i1.p3 TRINITY_DN2081_c0_g2~~TRINITY_DN2081_c0_g2_i1.p3  ORF type:complete len:145 (-),score=48.89 TRINITY_DN2081_c0_g2_i1:38-472(-)
MIGVFLLFVLLLPAIVFCTGDVLIAGTGPLERRATSRSFEHTYTLSQLVPWTWYEVRVSYAATTPCEFALSLVDDTRADKRTLLNTDKVVFQSDERRERVVRVRGTADYDVDRYTVRYNVQLDAIVAHIARAVSYTHLTLPTIA